MRRLTILSAVILIFSGGLFAGRVSAQATPESRARSFYAWYLHELNAERSPIQNSVALRRYVTSRMVRSIERALNRENGIDADIFIDAQDFDSRWERNITTSRAVVGAGRASLTVVLRGSPSFGTKRLRLVMRKENGVWKIDSVNGRASP